MPSLAPTLVIDLDGTLVDSLPAIARALNVVLAARGFAPLAPAAIARLVGDGVAVLLRRAFALYGAEADDAALAAFRADYDADPITGCAPYPGAVTTLAALAEAGWRFALCTNKPEIPAREMIDAFGLSARFAAIGGGDSFPTRKPDPRHLLATLAAAGGVPAAAVMLGDHANDVAAARGAGVPAIFAAWGYGAPEMAAGSAAVAPDFMAVPALLEQILR
jgi:phosphoglycolate phosphatase